MATASIEELNQIIANTKLAIRWRQKSLANVNPNYKINQPYIDKLTQEVEALQKRLVTEEAALAAATAPPPEVTTSPPAVTPTRPALGTNAKVNTIQTPYDDEGNLNPGWRINPETGDPFYAGQPPIALDPEKIQTTQTSQNDESIQNINPSTTDSYQGTPYDDDNNLNPGWTLDENNNPVYIGGGFVEPSTAQLAEQNRNSAKGILASKTGATTGATRQDQVNFTKQEDWRVRLTLAPNAKYLYKADNPGILKPLADSRGVIFPYTPSIQVNYSANYDATELIHSNYKVYQYKNSAVDNIQITCDFTAQDTFEANYLLAVIHFFRSVTKMFYGQDQAPKPGTPPPLCFLTGLGAFQFNEHPIAITQFNYSLPTDVDYIRAGPTTALAGVNQQSAVTPNNIINSTLNRLGNLLTPGGNPSGTKWNFAAPPQDSITYVPTKMQIQLTALPMISRNDTSNNFSLTDYASGKLLRGIQNVRGGFW